MVTRGRSADWTVTLLSVMERQAEVRVSPGSDERSSVLTSDVATDSHSASRASRSDQSFLIRIQVFKAAPLNDSIRADDDKPSVSIGATFPSSRGDANRHVLKRRGSFPPGPDPAETWQRSGRSGWKKPFMRRIGRVTRSH